MSKGCTAIECDAKLGGVETLFPSSQVGPEHAQIMWYESAHFIGGGEWVDCSASEARGARDPVHQNTREL